MIISCSTLGCTLEKYPYIADTLTKLNELGFRTIDLAAFENWQNINPSKLTQPGDTWSEEFIDALRQTDLRVSSFNCGLSLPINSPDFQNSHQVADEFHVLIKLAEMVDCPNITIQPGNPVAGISNDRSLVIAIDSLRYLISFIGARDIKLSVEGHQGSLLENPETASVFIKAVWPDIGFTYDPSHWVMQDISLPVTEPLLDMTYHVHVRNATTNKMQAKMTEGTVDFKWLINALAQRNYQGAVTIEYFSDFDADFRETLLLKQLLMDYGVDV